MKLSKQQKRIMELLQDGWELGVHTCTSGYTKIFRRAILQKNGLGKGAPLEDAKATSVFALEKMGLIKQTDEPTYPMVRPTRYELTKEGEEYHP